MFHTCTHFLIEAVTLVHPFSAHIYDKMSLRIAM